MVYEVPTSKVFVTEPMTTFAFNLRISAVPAQNHSSLTTLIQSMPQLRDKKLGLYPCHLRGLTRRTRMNDSQPLYPLWVTRGLTIMTSSSYCSA
ncbi:unnamed protein product [Sphenostylis stenocarpa]|uniref:Uncharacterized protein n=1 Tax=Sphenostylis stenocarpa TaxID=92480 RepID=A0AA86TFZ3_9FABA|nr:unnamed protein product [Sphenostylis stenocarpa]